MISFFFQAEDGIRDGHVTGVQTCALPIFFTGTLHMTEYAMSGSSNLKYGICKNPWNLDYFPGGSSTGSGAALAADMVIGSVGSDTGGSVRNPSSWSGVVSLKPTYRSEEHTSEL